MKRSISLRKQLIGWMTLLVLLQSLSLTFVLIVAQVYPAMDAETFRLFESAAATRARGFNTYMNGLVSSVSTAAKRLRRDAQNFQNAGLDLFGTQDYGPASALYGAEILLALLDNNSIGGAFWVTNPSGQAPSAIYIRNSVPLDERYATADSYVLEVGSPIIAEIYQMKISADWSQTIALPPEDSPASAFYYASIRAAQAEPQADMERYGIWLSPSGVWGDHQQAVCYTLPILDAEGFPYGVLGVEIPMDLFHQHYLSNVFSPYPDSFYAIAPYREGVLDLSWLISGSEQAQALLAFEKSLTLTPVPGSALFQTRLPGMGNMYCSIQPLNSYRLAASYDAFGWVLVRFVPQAVLRQSSNGMYILLSSSIGLTTLISLAGVILLSLAITRRITGLSSHVRGMSLSANLRFTHTGIREIDDLTAAVEKLNHSVVNASKTTSKILELTLLPIGGFEVSDESSHVRLSEYLYGLLGLDSGQPVTLGQWAAHYEDLTRLPTREHENVYQYLSGNQVKWLRILVAPTETGQVGVVLDVSRDIQEQIRMARALDCDAMTHLLNRVAFKREVALRIQSLPQQTGALIYADLDNLKYINDAFGHDMGDRLILRAGEMFGEFERHGGMVCRFSGDEFGVYLHGFAGKEEARELIQAQFARNERYVLSTPDGLVQKIRFTAGLSFYPEDAASFDDLFRLADFAMYEAKNSRKGALFEFNRDSYRQKAYLMENHEAINRLLDEGLIRFAYQPIVDAATGELFAYEALMRPLLKTFKSPSEILAVAAAQSKLSQLERLVLFNAFGEIHSQLQTLGLIKVFVNTIPSELLSEDDFLLLEQRYGSAFGNVCMEITEVENNKPGQMRMKIDLLRRQGIGLAIDDFGSGYSNEVRIWEIAPDYVKVDIALISGIDENNDKQKLVSNLIGFCKPKGIRVVAEGVERREELAKLVELGVDYMQGYYLGKPSFTFQEINETARQEILALRRQRDTRSNHRKDVTL